MIPAVSPIPAPAAVLDTLSYIHDALATAAALAAAEQLHLLEQLSAGPVSAADVARACAISDRGATLLLQALASLGVVVAAGDGAYYACAQPAQLATFRALWCQLDDVIRDGQPVIAADAPAGAANFYPAVVPLLAHQWAAAAERAAAYLAAPRLRVADVGAGAAPWSLALARRDQECRVTAVDLPAILAATRRAVAAAGCEAQFTLIGGDLFTADWSSGVHDLAIAGNLCHLFDESRNRRLLGMVAHALRPGGRVAIVDVLASEGPDWSAPVALYALGLLLRTTAGRVYPFSTYVAWLRDAGFAMIDRFDLGAAPGLHLITAHKAD